MPVRFLLELVAVLSTTNGAPSISLSTSVDVTSGNAVCSNIPPVEFTCSASEVSYLDWQVNGVNIQPTFNIGDNPMTVNSGPYILSLDRISPDPVRLVANMTIRLVANISNLPINHRITCLELVAESSVTLYYVLRGNPPALTDYMITVVKSNMTTAIFNFTADPKFNSDYGITSYKLAPSPVQGHSAVECPPLCLPTETCQCIGRSMGAYYFYIAVSAINCGNQEGPVKLIMTATSCFYKELQLLGTPELEENYQCTVLRDKTNGSIPIESGFVQYTGTSIGSVATYQCEEGYLIVGKSQRTCQSNGHWNGSTPQCRRIQNISSSSTITGIIIGVVTFIIGVALGVLLTIFIVGIYSHLCYKLSLQSAHCVSKQTQPLDQQEYQDVHLKPTSNIPVTQNTAYRSSGKASDQRSEHKEIGLERNVAYGPI